MDPGSHRHDGNRASSGDNDLVKRALMTLALVVAACSPASGPSTTTTAPQPAGTLPPAPTTTQSQAFEMQGCSAPPVTFSALCEVYDLIQTWHVDRPIDSAHLASYALQGLEGFETEDTEGRPRTIFCALPDRAFTDLCTTLAQRVQESELPVGLALDAAVTAMTDFGLDPFSYYLPPGQTGSLRDGGVVGGVGILLDASDAVGSRCLRISENCPLIIVFVLEDNAGEAAGLEPGDRIVAVNGETVDGAGFVSTAAAIAGDETGQVTITVERASQVIDITVERSELVVPNVVYDLFDGVGYLRIPDFDQDIPGLVNQALNILLDEGVGTIVVDLRDNPGGLVDSAIAVTSMFADDGVVFTASAPDESVEEPVLGGAIASNQRLVVLINKGTASSAEIVAGALHDTRGAVLVGTSTYGKDAIQIPFDLRNGGQLYLTVARWATPAGSVPGEGGLDPDRELNLTPEMTLEEVIEAAMAASS